MQRVPHKALSEAALRGVIEEYVTREGTDYGKSYTLEEKVAKVKQQLERGDVHILFDSDTETCNIMRKDAY